MFHFERGCLWPMVRRIFLLLMLWSHISWRRTISAICKSPANLIIARAISLSWSHIVRWQHRPMAGVVRDQPRTVLCPADFTRKKYFFTCNDVYINIKIRNHSSKDTGCLNKKDWDWQWQWWRWKPHLQKLQKHLFASFIHSQLLKRNIYFCIYIVGLQKWNI